MYAPFVSIIELNFRCPCRSCLIFSLPLSNGTRPSGASAGPPSARAFGIDMDRWCIVMRGWRMCVLGARTGLCRHRRERLRSSILHMSLKHSMPVSTRHLCAVLSGVETGEPSH